MNHSAIFSTDGREIWEAHINDMGKILVIDAFTYALKITIDVAMMPESNIFKRRNYGFSMQ